MSTVRLVAITQPRIEGVLDVEGFVAYAARVSNPANQNNAETSAKLLKYLMKNEHWSPFEMVSMTMEINTTRDIARQMLRHRSFSFQEFSQRYARATDLGFEIRDARMQDPKNRQASITTEDRELYDMWNNKQQEVLTLVKKHYDWGLTNGIAKEQARSILPEGNTCSRLYMAGTLRSWLHYCLLRRKPGTQLEHRVIGEQALEVVKTEFPSIAELLAT